jgi:hypothetical protein
MSTRIFSRAVALVALVLCTGAARGSLDGLADALALRVPSTGPDVGLAVRAPSLSPKLAADLGELVAGRLRARGFRVRLDGATDRGDLLVQIDLTMADGKLRASGTAWAIPSPLWAPGGPLEARAHLWAEVPFDEELRAYATTPTPVTPTGPREWSVQTLALGDVPLEAIDVGDVDGDRRNELVGATANEVIVWRVEGGRAVERARFSLAGRAAPVRPRRDVVTVAVEGGAILAHASPFADGVRRAGASAPMKGFAFPGLPGAMELWAGVDTFGGDGNALPDKLWSAAGLRRPGAPLVAAVAPPGVLWVRAGSAPPFTTRGAGAQVALAALERGELVATSEPVEPGEPDAIVVRALGAGLPVVHRIERLPGNVRALAAGDVDGDGRNEIVAAIRDDATRKTEVWLLR